MKDPTTEALELMLARVPAELLGRLRQDVAKEAVSAASPHDLDERGRFGDGWLFVADGKLGHFLCVDGKWAGEWTALSSLERALVVEGLGMSVLRLLRNGEVAAEHRYSLRHAKDMARLHRRLQKELDSAGAADLPPEPTRPDEKKVRCEKCGRAIPPWTETCPACLSRRKVLSRLMDFVKPYKWRAVLGLLMAVAGTLLGLVRPFLTQPMVDRGLGLAPGFSADYGVLLPYVLLLAAATILSAFVDSLRERVMATLGSRMGRDIRDKTYAHLHRLSLSFFSRKPTGSLTTRVTSDSDRIWDFVAFTLIEVLVSLLTIVGVGVALFVLNWRLACIVLLPVPLMLGLTIFFHKKLHMGFDRLFHTWSRLTAVVADALPGVRVIKAFSQENREVDRFGRVNDEFYTGEVSMITLWTLFGPILRFSSQIGTILVWLIGGYWVVKGKMTAGTLLAYAGYMWMFYGPIHMIAHMDRMFNRAAASVQRIFEILDTEPAIFSRSEALKPKGLTGRIELQNVSFSYDGIRKVLDGVSLDIRPGEMIGLAGPSGGGKTTMVNLICRFYDVLEGRIMVDGTDLREYDVETFRRHVGVVLQEPFLFHGTVASNVAYGKPEASLDEIIEAARAANAHEFIVGFPDGYDTVVGERGHTLSGGERQRISIARAILNSPSILILDEATSSVDTETERLIQQAIERLTARRTTIAIAHRLSTLRKADRLVIMDKGKIVEVGTHGELVAKEGGVYAKLVRVQTELQATIALG